MADPLTGTVITLPDGPWAGQRVRVLGAVRDSRSRLPLTYYEVQRVDTGAIGHREALAVITLAVQQRAVSPAVVSRLLDRLMADVQGLGKETMG